MRNKLTITKDTLEFLLITNNKNNPINDDLKNVIEFLNDELENAIGLQGK